MNSGHKRSFLPYALAHTIADHDLIVVDSHYPRGLALTHLYSDRVPEEVRSNTSTETALKWLMLHSETRLELCGDPTNVTCNHWDIDGFLAVWSLLNPHIAILHRDELIAAAHLGDFREFEPNWPACITGLKICCLLNHVERSTFCMPFGDLSDATVEHQIAQRKFSYFLPRFAQWLEKIDDYRTMWIEEYNEVLDDVQFIRSGNATIEEQKEIGLSIVHTPKPLHYYASFSRAKGGLVLTVVESKPYVEVEYKYETIVGRLDRDVPPRIDFSSLAERLSAIERTDGVHWTFDNIHEGGPMLRPEYRNKQLSREERYQSMRSRFEECPPTSIPVANVIELVKDQVEQSLATA